VEQLKKTGIELARICNPCHS